MIKISLRNIASFGKNSVILETDKKVNIVYGLNGTGKTTLSNFLYYRENKSMYKDCKLEGVNDEKILVYNQDFIQDNFYNQDHLKGIFTLSQTNKEAEEAIKRSNAKKENQEEEKTKKQQKKTILEGERGQKLETIKDTVWKIKTAYTGGDRVLVFCLDGLGRKDLLLQHINKIQKPEEKPEKTVEELKKEANAISGENVQKYSELQQVNLSVGSIEQNPIFSEVIVGNEDSSVADLIKKLNNSDWIKQGLNYLPDRIGESAEQCPFCQQETITERIAHDISMYFDENYEQKIAEIKQLENTYTQESLPAIENYRNHPLMGESKDQFGNLYNKLQYQLNKNRSQIEYKLKEPSQKIMLVDTKNNLDELNALIAKVNQKIQVHNQKIDNKAGTKAAIKNTFWQIMRWEYDNSLSQYRTENNVINTKIKEIESDIQKIDVQIKDQEQEIVQQQKNMVNIEDAIQNINDGLSELGIEGFSIQRHEKNSYRIVREGRSSEQFSTLSEGEKMIISFLYFMELCKGKESAEEIDKDKIVVIDDPVSSLSHTYVFNLSQWIKKYFFDAPYKNVFILTHSLYFFHELIGLSQDKGLFRITKSSSTGTQVQSMKQDEIKNEYESYWQVIKDHGDHKASDALLANSMRNILEHFFGFIDKAKLKESLNNLDTSQNHASFLRYMNRESHSTSINITDTKEINPEHFKSAFKNVFVKYVYKEHYEKMMKEKNDTSD